MHMYGCELWNLSYGKVNKFRIAWRKVKRRLWKLSSKTHNNIVHNLSSNFNVLLEKRIIKFIHNSLNCNNICNNLLSTKLSCKYSCFADNFRYLSYKYDLCTTDWNGDISFLMGKVKMKIKEIYLAPIEAEIVKELCSMRDNMYTCTSEFTRNELVDFIDHICLN